ncbi:sporulation integral membrane protein YtvI [Defluviitalea phaphyphila]|uniref:sporulation integral membrane protein YtvI n=1 Tax=Defluviitalea phaphyphila TaxID=1473580 RepID=UPI000731690E|nr:sporulation integral membrane protein YtvI [Defluviitalea phaphyphila]
MREFYKKNRQTINKLIVLILIILGLYLFFKYVFSYVAPFVFAWILSSLIEPLVRWFNKKCKLSRGISSILSILIVLIFIGSGLVMIIIKIIQEAQGFLRDFPKYYYNFINTIENIRDKAEGLIFGLPIQVQGILKNGLDSILNIFPTVLGPGVGKGSINFVIALPNALFVSIVTIIATFFMSKDREKIYAFIERQMPKSWIRKIDMIRRDLFGALLGYVRTQFILMIFVSTISIIGLIILGFKYALLIGIIIGIVDAFPILGSGTILIPWAIYHGINRNIYEALGLLIIYGIVVLFRQMLEPKVLGSQIGVYPLVTLMGMYIGIKIFGFIGIIIGPIFIIFLKTMQKLGIIHQWK